jgi:hypothetical protein
VKLRTSATLTLFVLVSLATSGCVVPPVGVYGGIYSPPVEYGYEPLLYNGYVVYYTDIGQPYYWLGGARVWVPSYARSRYVQHWQRYKHAYPNWYRHRGEYYKTHRFTGPGRKPPGPKGVSGTNWWNSPGPAGGPGAARGRPSDVPHYRITPTNPPGPAGGPQKNWDRRQGPTGGPGMYRDGTPRGHRNRDDTPQGRSGGGRLPPGDRPGTGKKSRQTPYSSPGEQRNSRQGTQIIQAPGGPTFRSDTQTWEGLPQMGGSQD